MTDFHKPGQPGQAAALPETYVQHPLSAAFPRMTAEEFQELKDSIEVLGVQNPITGSTPARLYQERSNSTVSPAAGNQST